MKVFRTFYASNFPAKEYLHSVIVLDYLSDAEKLNHLIYITLK